MATFITQYEYCENTYKYNPVADIELGNIIEFDYFLPLVHSFELDETGKVIPISGKNYWTMGWSDLIGYYAHNHSYTRPSIKTFDSLDELLQYASWLDNHDWETSNYRGALTFTDNEALALDIPCELSKYLLHIGHKGATSSIIAHEEFLKLQAEKQHYAERVAENQRTRDAWYEELNARHRAREAALHA